MADVGSPRPKGSELLPSIALVRAVAALIVVYDHLVGLWPQRNGVAWLPAQLADRWIFEPLHLMMYGSGMAVAMFFLVSGFVIVYVAQRETRREFTIKRALRIFPPLWLSIILLLVVYALAFAWSDAPGLHGYAVEDVLAQANPWPYIVAAMTLGNYLAGTPPVNGVAWTLIVEVLFYLIVALLLPLLKARPRVAMCVAFGALALLQIVAHGNSVVFLLAVNGVYVTYLFLGSLIYLRWAGRIGNGFFLAGTLAFAGLFLRGVRDIVLQPPYDLSDYGVSYALAWLAFLVFLLIDDKLRLGKVSSFFSRISYSLYLNHGGLGLVALTLLYPWLGYPAALALTFLLVVAISAASYRWVEAPSQRLARRWIGM
jgi:peptidoglycan/LPS O-acetylase OafA/YrhL